MNKKNTMKEYILLYTLFAIYSLSGVFSKFASMQEMFSIQWLLFYGLLLSDLFIYAFVWQKILRRFSLITAYSSKAMTVIWGILWGKIFFNESISVGTLVGGGIIIAGIYLMATEETK